MAKKAGIVWTDARGERALHVVTTSVGVGAIEAALGNASNAAVVECWEALDEVYAVAPTTGTYDTVRVTAAIDFVDALSNHARLFLPAPLAAVMNGDTVNLAHPLILAVTTAAVGNLLTGAGTPVVSPTGGQLIFTKLSGIATLT